MKRPAVLLLILLVCGGVTLALFMRQSAVQRQTLTRAVSAALDAHSPSIETLLSRMSGSPTHAIEDAIWRELQTRPATPFVERSDITVERLGAELHPRCVIQPRVAGLARRIIPASTTP